MYARYVYKAGATPANILADICALLCGTTDKTLLSADCVQADTEIFYGINPATWQMHDNAATASGKVLKQVSTGDGVSVKLLHLSTTSNYLRHGSSETWNATTHTGTNESGGGGTGHSSIGNASIAPVSGGTLLLYTDPWIAIVVSKTSSWESARTMNMEFSRSGPLTSLAIGYPNWCTGYATHSTLIPRFKNVQGAGESKSTNARCMLLAGDIDNGSSMSMFTDSWYYDQNEIICYNAFNLSDFPLFMMSSTTGFNVRTYLGKCLSNLKMMTVSMGGVAGDETTIDGVSYVKSYTIYDVAYNSCSWLIPKG